MHTVQQSTVLGQAFDYPPLLDLFSTSQSNFPQCIRRAPYVCIPPNGKTGYLYQTCCNDWHCPRCGQLRAKHEYGRMVEGARTLAADNQLYMLTITMPGAISITDAEKAYLPSTNRFLTSLRWKLKSEGKALAYAQVTERQERGHPHSHLIVTNAPDDAYSIADNYDQYALDVQHTNAKLPREMRYSPESKDAEDFRQMYSAWLVTAAVKAGMGAQVRLALVDAVEGASRYVAKYLFKSAIFQDWPKSWKRVRYSQNWPKLPHSEATSAFPVLSAADWSKVAALPGTIETHSAEVYGRALRARCLNVVCTVPNDIDLPEK